MDKIVSSFMKLASAAVTALPELVRGLYQPILSEIDDEFDALQVEVREVRAVLDSLVITGKKDGREFEVKCDAPQCKISTSVKYRDKMEVVCECETKDTRQAARKVAEFSPTNAALRKLIAERRLSRFAVSRLASASEHTVNAWLRNEGSASFRRLPQFRLDLILSRLNCNCS